MNGDRFVKGIAFLAEQGLNLFAVLPYKDLPGNVTQAMLAEDIPLHDYTSLVLIGHSVWSRLF